MPDSGGTAREHYEMAAYGTLVALAQAMGHTKAAKLLQQTLDEEKAADEAVGVGRRRNDQRAADAAHADDDEESVGAGASSAERARGKPVAASTPLGVSARAASFDSHCPTSATTRSPHRR